MPLFHDDQPGRLPEVHPSVAVELDWALSSAHTLGVKGSPAVEEMYRARPDLAAAVRDLWQPAERLSYPGYLELSVLAQRAGILFGTDSHELLAALEGAARAGGPDLPFVAETPDDRVRLRRRLQVLRSSTARRRRYLEVVGEVWSCLRPDWERHGRPAVEATVAEVRAQLERGRPWEQFASTECLAVEGVVEAAAGGRVAIVPAWYTHKGMLVDLPGLVVVGIRVESGAALSRARTESLARQLKVVAEPTRLALLDALHREEMTVTELAGRFSLSQPTVSNHVKVLRDAGLVTESRSGSRRVLSVEPAAVDGMVNGLRDLLGATLP